jgi:hypothetical protein
MRYSDGQEVHLGDRVRLGDDEKGVVVCIIDDDQFSPQFPKAQWAYLNEGALVCFPKYGPIHYKELEPDLEFLEREDLTPGNSP